MPHSHVSDQKYAHILMFPIKKYVHVLIFQIKKYVDILESLLLKGVDGRVVDRRHHRVSRNTPRAFLSSVALAQPRVAFLSRVAQPRAFLSSPPSANRVLARDAHAGIDQRFPLLPKQPWR